MSRKVGKVCSNVADAGCLEQECGLGAFQAEPACARLAGSQQGLTPVSPGFRELCLCLGLEIQQSAECTVKARSLESGCLVPLSDHFTSGGPKIQALSHSWEVSEMGFYQ